MSHITLVDIEIKDLECLRKAAAELGLEFCEGQKTFKWYGQHMGDYPLPEGFTQADMGSCDHALKVKGNPEAYEIGVVKRRDGKSGYHLMWDFWQGGYGLQQAVGANCSKLCQGYAEKVVLKNTQALRSKGWQMSKQKNKNGEIVVRLVRG